MQFQCQECDQSFTYTHNLTWHIKTVHGNEPRKDNEVRKQGHLACTDIRTCEDAVESVPQAASEYVRMSDVPCGCPVDVRAGGRWAGCMVRYQLSSKDV